MSDWLKKIPIWDWHDIVLDGFPGWERPEGSDEPWRTDFTTVHGTDVSSHQLASWWDDVATDTFYYRDYTDNNIPFVRDGNVYRSSFWFKRKADYDVFQSFLKERKSDV